MIEIDATKQLIDALLANSSVQRYAQDRVFPVVARQDTIIPYIVCRTEQVTVRRSKRGCVDGYTYGSEIVIVTANYKRMIQLASAVIDALPDGAELTNYSEDFVDPDKYVCVINVNIDK